MTVTIQTWLDTPLSDSRCSVIAEVAQSHDGSLGMAHAFIDAAARSGADAIKFQTHFADEESSIHEPWRTRFSYQDETRLDYWRRMEFSRQQWTELKNHANEKGIYFLSSPFSAKAVEMLDEIGVPVWKIASGEINNLPLLDHIIQTRKPIILSTGLSGINEIATAVSAITRAGNPLALLQCTSQYPSNPENIGLNVIEEFRNQFHCAVGLSDHSGKIFAGLAAATCNIQVLEVHLALSRDMFGPDVTASITPPELRTLVDGIRYIETVIQNPVDKSVPDPKAAPLRKIFMQSLFSSSEIKQGETLQSGHITTRKPGTGIPASEIQHVIGKKARRNIAPNSLIQPEDLE